MSDFRIHPIAWLGLAAALAGPAQAQMTVNLDTRLNEEVVMARGASGVALEATIYKPDGKGPFPLVVMNHGKTPGDPRLQPRSRHPVLAREFVRRGYAVAIPMRRGFSKSEGSFFNGGCDLEANARAHADDVQEALDYLVKQSWVDPQRILIAGQSHGGLTALALGTRKIRGVKGIINFAGVLRKERCAWQDALVDAFAHFGGQSTVPSLWFYGENDSYFDIGTVRRMHAAYTRTGAVAKLVAFGPFKNDAHGMVSSRDGVGIWWPETEKFLAEIGLPTGQQPVTWPPKSDYAELDNVQALPYVRDVGRAGYRTFLSTTAPRSFAISASGAWGWASGGKEVASRALSNCQKNSERPCKLYAVDGNVVWRE